MNEMRRWSVIITIVLNGALLCGCETTAEGQRTQAQGAGIGAALGAVAGAALGAATGGSRGAAQGAAAGAVLGGAAGFAYGTHVARQKAKYARAEDWLNACIASAQQANNRAYAYNQTLNKRLAALEQRSRAAKASKDRNQLAAIKKEAASLRQQSAAELKNVDEEVAAQQYALRDAQAKSSGAYPKLQQNVGQLEQNKAQLGRNVSRLATLENQIDI